MVDISYRPQGCIMIKSEGLEDDNQKMKHVLKVPFLTSLGAVANRE